MTRDEIKFHNFVRRLRANFRELIVKPIKIQLMIEFPELRADETLLNQIDVKFNSNQVFEEWKKLNNLSKKAEIVSTLTGITITEGDEERPYFHMDYIMDRIFQLSPEEKAENERYWAKSSDSGSAEGGDDGGGDDGGDDADDGGDDADAGGDDDAGGFEF